MKKLLFVLVGLLFFGGLSGVVYAATDPDDSLLDPYEIVAADVLLYEPVITEPGEKYVKVSLTMDGKLPGAFMVEMDMDGDTGTGGWGMHSIPIGSCQPGGPVGASVPGTDISIYIVLDPQSSTSPTAWCSNCTGSGGVCFYKDIQCSQSTPTCGTADCYKGSDCYPYDANCFVASDTCAPVGEPICADCFELTVPCTDENPCDYGMQRGEWYITIFDGGGMGGGGFVRGRIDIPAPPQGGPNGTAASLCITLPYSRIITDTKARGATYDEVKALDPSNVGWHISAWEDGAVGGMDYINADAECLEIVDIIPDSGNLSITMPMNPEFVYDECHGDYDKDGDVKDGQDVSAFKANMGRFQMFNPCPGIICP